MPSRPIVVHESFVEQYQTLVQNSHKNREKQIATGLEKGSTQSKPSGTLQNISEPNLQGKIHKHHLSRSDYRLIYMIDTFMKKEIVLPLFISETKKDKFDYANIPSVIVDRVRKALQEESYEEFEVWRIENKKINRNPFPAP